MNPKAITITLSIEGIASYRHLQKLRMQPAKLLRAGGEQLVIDTAIKNRLKLIKIKPPF